MNRTINAGAKVCAVLPSSPSIYYRQAANCLIHEIQRRVELIIDTRCGLEEIPSQEGDFFIWLCTLDTLPAWLLQNMVVPPTLRAFPDYRDHINLRVVDQEGVVHLIVLCGAEESLLFGVGQFLHNFLYYNNYIKIRQEVVEVRPLTPLRGLVFTNTASSPGYFSANEDQWDSWLTECALQGYNTVGIVPYYPTDWDPRKSQILPEWMAEAEIERVWQTHWSTQRMICQRANELGLRVLIYLPLGAMKPGDERVLEACWKDLPGVTVYLLSGMKNLFPYWSTSALIGQQFIDELKKWWSHSIHRENEEWWISASGLGEDDLFVLLDWLAGETSLPVKAVTSGPEVGREVLLMREMPFLMQMVSLTHLTRPIQVPNGWELGPERSFVYGDDLPLFLIEPIAKRYFELAPLTYGALGVSSAPQDLFQRFLWSQINWDPQPKKEMVMEAFGNYWFGADSAEAIREALFSLESAVQNPVRDAQQYAEEALAKIETAMEQVPTRRKSLARPSYLLLKYRAVLEIVLSNRVRKGQETKEQLGTLFSESGKEPLQRLQEGIALLNEAQNDALVCQGIADVEEIEQLLENECGYSPGCSGALAQPMAGLQWIQKRMEQGLMCDEKREMLCCLDTIHCRIQRELGQRGLLIDCGNGEADSFRREGVGYVLEMVQGYEPVSHWMIAMSENEGEPVEYDIPVPWSSGAIQLEILYQAPAHIPLKQTVSCGEILLDASVQVLPGKKEKRKYTIYQDQIRNGSMVLFFRPVKDHFAGVCEIVAEKR